MKKLFTLLTVLALSFTVQAKTNGNVAVSTNVPAESMETKAKGIEAVFIKMLESSQNAVGVVWDKTLNGIDKSIDFVMEQAPMVVQELLTWKFFEAFIWAAIWFVIALFVFFFSRKCATTEKKYIKGELEDNRAKDGQDISRFFKWVFCIISLIIFLAGVGTQTFRMVKIKVAPRVYLIEYAADLIKSRHN